MTCVLLALCLGTSSSVLRDLERIDRALHEAQLAITQLDLERQRLEDELAGLRTRLAGARLQEREGFEALQRRLRALYRLPSGARIALLGSIENLGDYLWTSRILRAVARHDRRLHDAYTERVTELKHLEATLERREGELEALREHLETERSDLARRRSERLELLAAVTTDRELRARAREERTHARRMLAAMVARLEPLGPLHHAFEKNRGRLPWPTAGTIRRRFGVAVDPETKSRTLSEGITLEATLGTKVQAVAPGRVVFADWLVGYGRVVILDHGGGYHTVMAHLDTVTVRVGDLVEAGTAIGTVGETGSLEGPGLYFEIRANGEAVDPAPWLRR